MSGCFLLRFFLWRDKKRMVFNRSHFANFGDGIDDLEADFELLLESEIGVVTLEEDKLDQARQVITELKGDQYESP
jgi:hypothetical protein